jgi:hypothetical protein
MQKTARKNPRLKARVEELDRELSRMNAEIRAISRAAEHPDRESAVRRLQSLALDRGRSREKQGNGVASRTEGLADGDETSDLRPAAPQGAGGQGGAAPESPTACGGADPRFANYFVTGSLHSVRPLRQERRVQRNKALLMLFIALLLMYGVFSLIF